MATNAKNLAELLNTDTTVAVGDIADGSVTSAKLASGAAIANIGTGAITTAKLADNAVTSAKALNLGRRNLVINGAMSINQRGATSGITSGYFVDRFQLSGVSASAVITSSTPTEFPTAITVSATSGNPIILQKIESKMVQHLSGKVVTVSFYAKNISNATTLYTSLQYAGSADNFGSTTTISEQNLGNLTTDWVKYTASWTVPAGGLNGLSLNILCAGSSTFTMGVTGIQLELGATATDFEHRSYAEELSLCQRYYHQANFTAGPHYGGGALALYAFSTTEAGGTTTFPVTMRSAPTVRTKDAAGNIGGIHRAAVGNVTSGVAIGWAGNADANAKGISQVYKTNAWTAGNMLIGGYEADAEL